MRTFSFRIVLVLIMALMALGQAAHAQQSAVGKKALSAAHRFAANNSLFVLYHEVGHLIIDQLQLPVLGREEDAADNIATWTLLNKGTPEANAALADAAYGWLLSGNAYDVELNDRHFSGQHSLNKQRAFQIVCLMVGRNSRAFRTIATQYGLDRNRQDNCFWDYDLVDRTMRDLRRTHVQKKARSGGVTVTYHDASGFYKPAADAFRQSGIFDAVAAEIAESYPITQHIEFNARLCGESNAFYDPSSVEVIFCYELMDEYIALALKDIRTKGNFTLGPGGSTRLD